MATNLFDLSATLTLTTEDFNQKVDDAMQKGSELRQSLEELGNPPVIPGIDQNGNVFATIIGDASEAKAAVDDIDADIDEKIETVRGKSDTMQAIFDGVAGAVSDLITEAFDALVEYCGEAIEQASKSGSELAKAYNESVESLSLSKEIAKGKVGEALLPFATAWNQFLESLTGVTDLEKANYLMGQIESYRFENIKAAKESFSGLFGIFDQVEMPEEAVSLGDQAQGLLSQIEYWESYNETVTAASERLAGFEGGLELLSEFNTGTPEGLAQMQAFADASDAELAGLIDYYNKARAARDEAAETSAEIASKFDESITGMQEKVDGLVTSLYNNPEFTSAGQSVGSNLASGLEAGYPSVAAWVDAYNAKLASIHEITSSERLDNALRFSTYGTSAYDAWKRAKTPKKAIGMDYVPYNGYTASLHEGEAILTKSEATAWRAGDLGSSAGLETTMGSLVSLMRQIAANTSGGTQIMLDGNVLVGQLAPKMDRQLGALASRRERGY